MNKKFGVFLSFLLTLGLATARGQEADSTMADEKPRLYDFVIFSGKFQNAFTFLGRDFGQTIPFFNLDAMYLFHNGIYVDIGAYKFLQTDVPFQYAATLGYVKDLSKKTDIHLSYSQYFVEDISDVIGIQNLGLLQSTFGLDWNVMYSTLQVQALVSDQPDFFIGMTHSRYFQFDQELLNTFRVSFEPKIQMLWGTRNFYWMAGFDDTEITPQNFEQVKLLTGEASLPLMFSLGNWDLEFESRYVIPMNMAEFDDSKNRFVFSLGLTHALPIRRKK